MIVLETMFSTRAYIEITCYVPFLKSYKPATEVGKVFCTFLTKGYNFGKGTQHVII
jgi:hypothetical protein